MTEQLGSIIIKPSEVSQIPSGVPYTVVTGSNVDVNKIYSGPSGITAVNSFGIPISYSSNPYPMGSTDYANRERRIQEEIRERAAALIAASEAEINKELARKASEAGRSLSSAEVKAIQEQRKFGTNIQTGNLFVGNIPSATTPKKETNLNPLISDTYKPQKVGYSYVDKSTGKGYEVDYSGVKREIDTKTGKVKEETYNIFNPRYTLFTSEGREEVRVKIATETGKVVNLFTLGANKPTEPPSQLSYGQQLPYQQKGTIVSGGITPTTEDLWRLNYRQQAGTKELDLFSYGQQVQLDRTSGQEAETIFNDLSTVGQNKVDSAFKKIQARVDNGELSADEAQKELDKYAEDENKRLQEEFKKRHEKAMLPYIEKATEVTEKRAKEIYNKVNMVGKEYAFDKFVGSALFFTGVGFVSALAPPIGAAYLTAGAIQQATSIPETISYAKEDPWGFGASITGGLVGGSIGGYLGGRVKTDFITTRNTAKVQEYLKEHGLKVDDIERTYSISNGKATKLGKDNFGNQIWDVEQRGVTKFINKKTGAVLDKVTTLSVAKAVSKTGSEATASVVKATTLALSRDGFKVIKNGNVLQIKGSLSKLTGTSIVTPTEMENVFKGKGKFDISSGFKDSNFKMKVSRFGDKWKAKAKIVNPPRYSAFSDFFSKIMTGKYKEAKRIGAGKVLGKEEIIKTKAVTDVSKNFNIDKFKEIVPHKREPLPSRDVSIGYLKSFVPKNLKTWKTDFSMSSQAENLVQIQKTLLSSKQAAKVASQAATQAQMASTSDSIIKSLLGKANAIPKEITTSTKGVTIKATKLGGVIGAVKQPLIESEYPTYVGGTKVSSYTRSPEFSMTGGVVNDYSEENMGVLSIGRTAPSYGVNERYDIREGYKAPQITRTIPSLSPSQSQSVSQVQNALLGQRQPQIEKQRMKYVQKYKQPSFQPPKFTFQPPSVTYKIKHPVKVKMPEGYEGFNERDFGFDVYAKIKGKQKKVGTRETQEEAMKYLKQNLLGGLQASGYVVEKKTGRKVPIPRFEDYQFRIGKRDIYKLVQRKGGRREGGTGRLTTQEERREIQRAKKTKDYYKKDYSKRLNKLLIGG